MLTVPEKPPGKAVDYKEMDVNRLLMKSEVLPYSACLSARVARRRGEVCSCAYIERRACHDDCHDHRSPHAQRVKPCGGAGRIRLRR